MTDKDKNQDQGMSSTPRSELRVPRSKQKILIVDDKKENLVALRQVLGDLDADVVEATTGNEALAATLEHDFAVAILDVMMPGMDGYELAEHLRGDKKTRIIPIVFLTASLPDERNMFKGYEAGAIDYITKPYLPEVLVSKVRVFLEMDRDKRELQRHRDELEALVGERTKEIKCLYAVSSLVAEPRETVEETLEAAVELIPPGWRYHEIACARVVFENREFVTANFKETPWRQSASIDLSGQAVGRVDVFYLEEKPEAHDGPFLGEERELIIDIARQLGVMIQRKRAEEAVQREREQAERYLDIAGVMLATLNADEKITLINQKGCEILGYNEEELVGENWFDLLVPREIRKEIRGIFAKLMSGDIEPVEYYENPLLTKNGEQRLIAFHNTAVRDSSGQIVGVLLSGEDITERKRAEETLRESEAKHRTLVENIPQTVFLKDRASVYVSCNTSYARDLGIGPDDIAGKTDYDFHPRELAEKYRADDQRVMDEGTTKDIEEPLIKGGQETWVHTVKTPVRDAQGNVTGILGIVWDITEQKKAADEKQALEAQLRLAQKMESIGRLAGGVAHDFNNMLTGIKGFAGFARDAVEEGSGAHEDLTEVLALADRAAGLTRQLLAFSRRQTLEPVVLDLNKLIEEQAKMLTRLLGEDIELQFLPEPDLGSVRADPGQIEQVIMNLAVNARDAMLDGGKLTIETANVELGDDYARNHVAVVPGPHVMLAASDTGSGMDEKTRQKVFDPFFTTKGAGKGTGLGLSTVYGIVKQHGGNIWVYSEPGKGTTFKVYLPRVAAEAEPRPRTAPSVGGGSETILLVEDDRAVRDVGRRHLEDLGYTVLCASCAREAEEVAAKHGKPIDLLLTDVVMPDRNGRELYEALAASQEGLKVLYMSGYTENAIVHHGMLEGGIPYLQKPFERKDLATKVRQALER